VSLILVIAAVVVSILVFLWLIKVVRATLRTALLVAFVVLVLQFVFGIGPSDLWAQLSRWFQTLLQQ